MPNAKTPNPKTTSPPAPARQRTITNPSDFLRWLVDKLNQQGPRMRVDHDTAAAVWTFVDQLVQSDRIECPAISSVELFFQNQWTDVGTVELGRPCLCISLPWASTHSWAAALPGTDGSPDLSCHMELGRRSTLHPRRVVEGTDSASLDCSHDRSVRHQGRCPAASLRVLLAADPNLRAPMGTAVVGRRLPTPIELAKRT